MSIDLMKIRLSLEIALNSAREGLLHCRQISAKMFE